MLDPAARASLPHTTRWFTTLAAHPLAAPVLGPVKLAERAQDLGRVPAAGIATVGRGGAKAAGGGDGGGREQKPKKEKAAKQKGEKTEKAKAKLANGAPGGGGGGTGAPWFPPAHLACRRIFCYL